MDYIDYLNNSIVKEQYHKIDLINPYAINHGMKHIKNVCNIMNKLCDILQIENDQKDALLIACALHDIGQVDGREKHGTKSKEYIMKHFSTELQNNKYYNDILESIEKHSDINDENLSLFCLLVQFADKADFSKNRLEDNYREKYRYYCYEEINDIEFIYTDKVFGLNIISNETDNFEEQFLNEKHPYKVLKVTEKLAKSLNRVPIIEYNNKKLVFQKR